MIRLLPQSGGGWEGVAWQLPKKVKNKKRPRMIPVGVTMDLVYQVLPGSLTGQILFPGTIRVKNQGTKIATGMRFAPVATEVN